jgi:hypothetical protein
LITASSVTSAASLNQRVEGSSPLHPPNKSIT